MSLETYTTNKTKWAAKTLPVWSNTWPGMDGCSSRTINHLSPYTPDQPPSGVVKYYTPSDTVRWKSRPVSGKVSANGPPFRFTEYSVGKKTISQYLITTERACNGCNRFYQFGHVSKVVTT